MVTCLGKTRSASKSTQGSSMPWPKERSLAPQMSCTRERTISISPKGGDHEDDGRAVAEWPEEEPVHAEHRECGERHCQGKDGEGVPVGEGGE